MNIILTKYPIHRHSISVIHGYLVCVKHGHMVCDLHDQYTHF